ncbi:MAG: hypothetical protein ABFS03_11305, partial [Chloroflexota bacterium]
MKRRNWFLIILFGAAALLLAFPLKNIVRAVLIKPALYLLWGIKLIYHTIPQFWLWAILLFVILLIMLSPLFEIGRFLPRRKRRVKEPLGPIGTLAETVDKSSSGIYFKWVIANRMSKIMRDWLAYREHTVKRWHARDITKLGWSSSKPIKTYLDVGLNGSFADYP